MGTGRPTGRPNGYSREMAEKICSALIERHETGRTRSIRDVCDLPGMPCEKTVYLWLLRNSEFQELYRSARETLAEMMINDLIEEASGATPATVHVSRLKIDTMKFWAMKVLPRVYGDKVSHEVTGKDGAPLLTARRMDDMELARYAAFLLAKGAQKAGAIAKEPEALKKLEAPAKDAKEESDE